MEEYFYSYVENMMGTYYLDRETKEELASCPIIKSKCGVNNSMNVLMVDQLAKKTGKDTVTLARELNEIDGISVDLYLADQANSPIDEKGNLKIKSGFHGVYEGNYFHKAFCYFRALFQLADYIKKNNYDIIYLQWFSLPWFEWIFVSWLKHTRHKVSILVHDVIPRDRYLFDIQFLNIIYNKADVLFVHTEYAEKLLHEKYKITTRTKVITQAFCKKSDYVILNKMIARNHFNISENKTVFLFFGTIHPSKGLDLLISAFSRAFKDIKNIYLLVAGEPRHINLDEYKKLIEKKLSENNSMINFGFISQEEEQFYFSAADVLCLPYLEESQSGVAQLGLMYELPMIASDVGAMADVVRDGKNGILVPPHDEGKLSEAILNLAREKDMRKSYSACSKKLGETEFSVTNKAEIIADIYGKIAMK